MTSSLPDDDAAWLPCGFNGLFLDVLEETGFGWRFEFHVRSFARCMSRCVAVGHRDGITRAGSEPVPFANPSQDASS